jgi:hypothetical protein
LFPPARFIVISISFHTIDARRRKHEEAIDSTSQKAPIFAVRTPHGEPLNVSTLVIAAIGVANFSRWSTSMQTVVEHDLLPF